MQEQKWIQQLSQIVHDLKSPLSSTKTLLDGIEGVGELNERQTYFMERAKVKLVQMTSMINTIMEVAWLDADQPLTFTEIDLPALLRHTIDMLKESADERGLTINQTIDESVNIITADAQRMGQVLNNLLSNAVKYNRDEGQINISVTNKADHVQVKIADCGNGIPFDDQPYIFEKFYRSKMTTRSKIEGTGLGLAIVKAVIDKHGGEVWFESVPEKGTTFTFTIPHQVVNETKSLKTASELLLSTPKKLHSPAYLTRGDEVRDAVDDSIQESYDRNEDADSHAEAGRRSDGQLR